METKTVLGILFVSFHLFPLPSGVTTCLWWMDETIDSSATTTTVTDAGATSTESTTLSTAKPSFPSTCGHSQYYHNTDQPGTGVVGGTTSRKNEYPWLARIQTSVGYTCGASIISNYYLLTAAHCLDGRPSYTEAMFADHNQEITETGEFSIRSTNYTIHPLYNADTNNYDLALLRLQSALNFTTTWAVQKICLPKSCSANCKEGMDAYIAGWGVMTNGAEATYVQHAKVPIASHSTCSGQYEGITNKMICAGYESGGIDTCQGDSGGPLMTVENGTFVLCGITSFGNGCGLANSFGVYTSVCAILDWIKATADIT